MAAARVTLMPNYPRADEFGELGFTQLDRDELKKASWLLGDIRERLQAYEQRLTKLEDGRAHQQDLAALETKVESLMLKAAAAGGIISVLAFLEPILIKLFWH